MPARNAPLHNELALLNLGLGRTDITRGEPVRKAAHARYVIADALEEEIKAVEKVVLPEYKYWWAGSGVLDQGSTGTCVGHAFAHRWNDSPVPHANEEKADPFQLYRWAADRDQWSSNDGLTDNDPISDPRYDEGTDGDSAAKGMLDNGMISEYRWLYRGLDGLSEDQVYNRIKRWILLRGTVCMGANWYESEFNPRWIDASGSGEYRWSLVIDESEGGIAGGHEYMLCGLHDWTADGGDDTWKMKNSWGDWWGAGGFATMPEATIRRLIAEDCDFILLKGEVIDNPVAGYNFTVSSSTPILNRPPVTPTTLGFEQ